jgi:hypothetical protein
MGERIPHEVHPAALPRGGEDFRHRRLDALMRVGDDELDAAQAPPGELAQEGRPERLGFGRTDMGLSGILFAGPVCASCDEEPFLEHDGELCLSIGVELCPPIGVQN